MIKNCGCDYGCCFCGEFSDDNTDVFYNPTTDNFFLLVDGASSIGPVGWEVFDGLIYLGKLGDNYFEHIGRMVIHTENLISFRSSLRP